jgi:hypothetical protein
VTSLFVDDRPPIAELFSAAQTRRRARARWLPAVALLAPSLVFLVAFT